MPLVKFTSALKRFHADLTEVEVQGNTIAEVVQAIGEKHPKLPGYLTDERGALRKHVNIFIGDKIINDKQKLQDPVNDNDGIFIMQAIPGG